MAEHATTPLDGTDLIGHRPALIRLALRTMNHADAAEIADETLLLGFRFRDRYDSQIASESTWLKGIAAKLIAHHHRGLALQQRILPRLATESVEPSAEDGILARLEAIALLAASVGILQHLPAVEHQLVLKSASALLGGYSAGLGANDRVRLHRIRQKLRAAISGLDGTDGLGR